MITASNTALPGDGKARQPHLVEHPAQVVIAHGHGLHRPAGGGEPGRPSMFAPPM